MFHVNKQESGHVWKKLNLVTITGEKGGGYDILECEKCGIKGRAYSLTDIRLKETYGREKAFKCPFWTPDKPAQIQITQCGAVGGRFANLTPGSKHVVIAPPPGEKDSPNGVWVMGVGEPVKVLRNEYLEIR